MSELFPRLIPQPVLEWDGDTPRDQHFGDVYYSRHDGLGEARSVFLDACDLPKNLIGRAHYCVGELGFGTGLNLLALMACRKACPSALNTKLDMLSFDSQLMSAEQAARAHRRWPELAPYSKALIAQWPPPVRGVHRLELGQGVCLTLFLDEITQALPEAHAQIHAWFLDGFAPAKNPQIWSPFVFSQIARLSAPGAVFGTWSAAGSVRRGLENAGFAVSKHKGFASKRERLSGVFVSPARPVRSAPRSVLIIGAGIAGAACARAFLAEGCEVTVLDAHTPASQASGNVLALLAPRLDTTDTPVSRALTEAFLLAMPFYERTPGHCARKLEVIHLARTPHMRQKFARLSANPSLPASLLRFEAEDRAIITSCMLRPKALIAHWLKDANVRQAKVCELDLSARPCLRTAGGETLKADIIIIACGAGTHKLFPQFPFQFSQGQLETARTSSRQSHAIMDNQYVLQWDNRLAFGSGFVPLSPGEPAQITALAKEQNHQALHRLRPDISSNELMAPMESRASVRVSLPDRLPLAGWVSEHEDKGVMIATGLGARGFGFAPLIGTCLAALACGRPVPAEKSVLAALSPARYSGAGRSS